MENSVNTGPFSGILVIDFSHGIDGPFGTQMLCDLGARVIKIEQSPHGDESRTYGPFVGGQSVSYAFINHGKESIKLNLNNNKDYNIFINMVKQADVLVDNHQSDIIHKLGLTLEELHKINPKIIYASSSLFGHTSQLRSDSVYNIIIRALSGFMLENGISNSYNVCSCALLTDLCSGLYIFSGIVSALYARDKNGQGAHVDIAIFDSFFSLLSIGTISYIASQNPSSHFNKISPVIEKFDIFETKDKPIIIFSGNNDLFISLCESLEKNEWINDKRFINEELRSKHKNDLKNMIEKILKNQSAEYWLEKANSSGAPFAPVLSLTEAAQIPQIQARKMIIKAGDIRVPGNPIKISGYPDKFIRQEAASINQHSELLRHEFK